MPTSQAPAVRSRACSTLIEDLETAWERTDALFDLIAPDALHERPIALRNPLVFYVGHLPAFTWNLLMRGVLGAGDSSEPEFDALFDFGIDPEDEQETPPEPEWPELGRILAYRDLVRETVRERAGEIQERAGANVLATRHRILHVVLEHEVMHHETLLYMLQELDPRQLRRAGWWHDPVVGSAAALETGSSAETSIRIPSGAVRLGADFDAIPFGWDNEFPARGIRVEAFELDRLPVTIDDWRGFLADGGYRTQGLWSDAGWAHACKQRLAHPQGWMERGGKWFVRTLFDAVPLEEAGSWPVCVTHAEAQAYARWKGKRLPSEAELFRAAYGSEKERPFPWGDALDDARANVDFRHHSPTPVGAFPGDASPFGVRELIGNGWEWSATPFDRHAGFEAYMDGYRGYSADFFDGAHFALFGGSWATGACLLRRSFRNWFRFNYPYPFTKFRLAADA